MKILYIHQYFKTPQEGGSIRSYYLAKGLVEAGHEVVMITAWNKPIYKCIDVDGIKTHYLPIFYENKLNFLARLYAFLKFSLQSFKYILTERGFDKAYVMTTPLSTGLQALFVKFILRKPYLFEVGDLWPEVPVQMGYIKNWFFKWLLYGFEKLCYRNAEKIVALSTGIADYIKAKVPDKKINVIPNIADLNLFEPNETPYSKEKGNFSIGYFGTAGMANHLEFMIEFARECNRKALPVNFVIQAEGAELNKIKTLSEQVNNITFLPWGDKLQVKKHMEEVDAIYLSFHSFEALGTGSPNKFFDGLAAGKLVISNFTGWIKDLIQKEQCGFYYNPLDPEKGAGELENYLDNKEKVAMAKGNALELASQFSLQKATEGICQIILD